MASNSGNRYIDLLKQFGSYKGMDQKDGDQQGLEHQSRPSTASDEESLQPPSPHFSQAGYAPGGVPLSPIIEQNDSEKTPKAVQAAFQEHSFAEDLVNPGKNYGPHKRVISDLGSPQIPSGFAQNVQRPRSHSVVPVANNGVLSDYTKSNIWLDKTVPANHQYAASPASASTPLSRSTSGTPSSQRRASGLFSAGNGTFESPVNVHAGIWDAVPNQITPTKQRSTPRGPRMFGTVNQDSTREANSLEGTPWRIPQRRDGTSGPYDDDEALSSPTADSIADLIRATGGVGIQDSPVQPSFTSSHNQESDELHRSEDAFQTKPTLTLREREDKKRLAKELAAYIKSGALERSNSKQPMSVTPVMQPGSAPLHFFQQMHPVPTMTQMITPPMDALVAYFRSNNGPSYEEIMNNMPLEDKCMLPAPAQIGVVHISDIPYSTTRQEIVAFFGRNARFVHQPPDSPYYAIHIIMERSTGKSMDCFVEFQTPEDAVIAARRFTNQPRGRGPRLGHRAVTVTVVDPADMMKELFPRAKFVQWHGVQPVVVSPPNDGFVSSGFQGFVTNEEMHMTVKLATDPKRSKYTANHLQRTYESIISLLSKYPWHMTNYYTISERDRIFQATVAVIAELCNQVQRATHLGVLTPQLLSELLLVAHGCPGFTDGQRALIVDKTLHLTGAPPIPLTILAPQSPFIRLTKKNTTSDELMKYFASILCQATTTGVQNTAVGNPHQLYHNPFGAFAIYPAGLNVSQLTMWDAANMEWAALDALLQCCLPHSQG